MNLYYDLESKNGFKYSPSEFVFTDGDGKKYAYIIEGDADVNDFGGRVSGKLSVRNPGDDDYHELTDEDCAKLNDMIACERHLCLYVEPIHGSDDEEDVSADDVSLTSLALYVDGKRYFISDRDGHLSAEVI